MDHKYLIAISLKLGYLSFSNYFEIKYFIVKEYLSSLI